MWASPHPTCHAGATARARRREHAHAHAHAHRPPRPRSRARMCASTLCACMHGAHAHPRARERASVRACASVGGKRARVRRAAWFHTCAESIAASFSSRPTPCPCSPPTDPSTVGEAAENRSSCKRPGCMRHGLGTVRAAAACLPREILLDGAAAAVLEDGVEIVVILVHFEDVGNVRVATRLEHLERRNLGADAVEISGLAAALGAGRERLDGDLVHRGATHRGATQGASDAAGLRPRARTPLQHSSRSA